MQSTKYVGQHLSRLFVSFIESAKTEITAFLFDDMLLLTLTKGAKKGNRLRVGEFATAIIVCCGLVIA